MRNGSVQNSAGRRRSARDVELLDQAYNEIFADGNAVEQIKFAILRIMSRADEVSVLLLQEIADRLEGPVGATTCSTGSRSGRFQ